jgi:hypothetical protein
MFTSPLWAKAGEGRGGNPHQDDRAEQGDSKARGLGHVRFSNKAGVKVPRQSANACIAEMCQYYLGISMTCSLEPFK